jgi:hypothetical protein
MNDELDRLLARLAFGEAPPVQALLRLQHLLIPRAVWRALSFDGSALSLAEVSAILTALDDPRSPQRTLAFREEASEVERWRDALVYALDAAKRGEDPSEDLLGGLQNLLRGHPAGVPADEQRPGALAELVEAWRALQKGITHPLEDAAWLLAEMARRRPLSEKNDATARLAASMLLVKAGLPPLLFGPERRDAYIEALREPDDLDRLARFLAEEASIGLADLLSAERTTFPASAVRFGAEIVERQRALMRRLEELPAEDPALLEARGAEVDALSAWIDYIFARLESAARGPLYDVKRAPARNDYAVRLLSGLYLPLYLGRAAALSLRVSPHRDTPTSDRPVRFPPTDAALTIFVVATRASLRLIASSPQTTAIREARRRPPGAPTSRPVGFASTNPPPNPKDVLEARLELDGPPLAEDWPQPETESWILSWVERLAQGYDDEFSRLNQIEILPGS